MPPILIDDATDLGPLLAPVVEGESKGRGHDPTQVDQDVQQMFDPPNQLALIPRSEWSARIKEGNETKSFISHVLLRHRIPSLDQGPNGYCWGHSTVGCVQAVRALQNQPYIPLSAYAVCATIKRGVNEGGWCGLSAKFLRERGVPSQELWPQGDRNYRKYDRPEVWANAGLHKVTEEWVDLARDVYEQNLTFDAVMTCLLNRVPVAGDFNWWAHSVLLCDPVEVEPGSFGIRLRNSWGDGWGEQGFGVLRGQRAVTDGALAIRVTGFSYT